MSNTRRVGRKDDRGPRPNELAWLDQEDAQIAQVVRTHGWAVQYVGGDCNHPVCRARRDSRGAEPPFAYTIGLFGLGHPELLVFGLDPETSMSVLNEVSAQVLAGRNLISGEVLELDCSHHRVAVEPVPNAGAIVFGANRFYDRPREASVPVFQLSWDDGDGCFPWDPGYALAPFVQPRPGTFVA